ncbi:Lrp/AsnC family transcriptional regulator [Mycobacterium sp. SM1]|uniref:Lrp/AsnC family transcriptional regulator n=1 Tax=Mycobacterium sp. SM1 TaxID=2816243 RepID=UPI001BCC321A|nr:Lrp/AsnC family transcriptional regulator [Mycobacterium sp. SM1]MBS4730659.1 Lrp/AsnC family transcriptional regulator [Mycobacterium sp. SM1]
MTDALDVQILHALKLAPRVSFRRIAAALDVSEQTVARRYHRLRRAGVLRVVGLVNPHVHGNARWVARIHTKPDRIHALAEALVRRSEVTYANVASDWTELVCIIHAPIGETPEDVLLQQLPRSASVLDISVDLLLHTFGEAMPSSTGYGNTWTGYGPKLTGEQAAQILADPPARTGSGRPITPTAQDRPLLDALADDARAPLALLAERTGWSAARVARRIAALEAAGTLLYEVELLPERLGYHLNAMLWLTVAPQHLQGVGEQIAVHDEIAFAAAVSGRNNLVAVAICQDANDLYRYLTERLAAIDHIRTFEVSIRTQRLKQAASLVAHGRLFDRAPAPWATRAQHASPSVGHSPTT